MVDTLVRNPLKRELYVCNMLLHCKISCKEEKMQLDKIASLDYDQLFAYYAVIINLSLGPMESKVIRLNISPIHSILDTMFEMVDIRFDRAFESTLSNSPVSMHAFLKHGPKNVTFFNNDHRSIEHYLKDDGKLCFITRRAVYL